MTTLQAPGLGGVARTDPAPIRAASTEERAARRHLAQHGEPGPEARFALGPGVDRERRRDALATALMDRFRRTGDREAFERLAALMRRPLEQRARMRLRRAGLGMDPEEILQDTLVNVYRYPDRFDASKPGAFRAWSSTIVDNVIRRQLRRSRSGPDVLLCDDERLRQERDVRSGEPSQRAAQGEECEAACQALALLLGCYLDAYHDLSERERFVLQMVEVNGARYSEVATVLGVRPEALKMVVFRARRRIHERLTVMFSRAATGMR